MLCLRCRMPDNQRCMSHTRLCPFFLFWVFFFFGKKKRMEGRIKKTFMTVRVSEVVLIPRSRGFYPCFPSTADSSALPPGEEKSRIDKGGYYKCGFTATAKKVQVSTVSIPVTLLLTANNDVVDVFIFFSSMKNMVCEIVWRIDQCLTQFLLHPFYLSHTFSTASHASLFLGPSALPQPLPRRYPRRTSAARGSGLHRLL